MFKSLFCCGLLLGWCSIATADVLVVMPGSQQIMIGTSRYIDILITSDAPLSNPDVLDSFSAKFRLTRDPDALGGGVQFVNPQSDAQGQNSNYVFHNDSLNVFLGDPFSSVTTADFPNDQLIGGDGTISGNGFLLASGNPHRLLFRLELSAANVDSRVGDKFYLALIDDTDLPTPVTHFWDPLFNDLGIDPASFTPTLITVVVPEPCSLCGSAIGVLGAVVAYRKRRRRSLSSTPRKDFAGSPT